MSFISASKERLEHTNCNLPLFGKLGEGARYWNGATQVVVGHISVRHQIKIMRNRTDLPRRPEGIDNKYLQDLKVSKFCKLSRNSSSEFIVV